MEQHVDMTAVDAPFVQVVTQPAAQGSVDFEAPSLFAYPATYILIAVNIAIFVLMIWQGTWPPTAAGHVAERLRHLRVSGVTLHSLGGVLAQVLTAPFSERTLTVFGSCIPARVVGMGEWWRVVSSIFVHVTLLHLLLNMWCLWNLGLFGEPLLGKHGLVAVYLLTGAAGMLQSVMVSWLIGEHDLLVAGASGAIFGLAGILIVLLSNKKLAASWQELRSLRRQVLFFALANLLLGMLPGLVMRFGPVLLRRFSVNPTDLPLIDNNAHLGGLICGLGLGLLLFPRLTSGRSSYRSRQVLVFGSATLFLLLLGYAFASFAHGAAG